MFPKPIDTELPATINDAVKMLIADLPLLDRTRLGAMAADELDVINQMVGSQIARDFRLWSGNDTLLSACLAAAVESEDATMVIIHAMWKRLQETHVLRRVK
ncbi:conserved hypothetical protein [Desulfosarcina cetonica]|uniref:DUF6794 domain-containing protein n=1 Tax=Desulfosarcina cetonica TaxID=90730 RepID=UPI0012EE8A1D|nr:DUF6794 domain-containing protein [Desulfosarcina cetonica]VTR64769.1 conserved hypothetical protein [Desulfosarcina cetonica]